MNGAAQGVRPAHEYRLRMTMSRRTRRRRYGFSAEQNWYPAGSCVTLSPHLVPTQPQYGAAVPARGRQGNGKQEDLSMDHRLVFAPARPVARAFAVAAATTMLTALMGAVAVAQTPPAPPA